MADKRLTELDVLSLPDPTDVMHVVDISDLTGSAEGTSKQSTIKDIVIAGGGTPANHIIINSVGDFAVQDATTITLESGKTYIRGSGISTSKRFIVNQRVTIWSASVTTDNLWEYTGTDSMFTGIDFDLFQVRNLAVRCPNAFQIFSMQDATILNSSNIFFDVCIATSDSPTTLAAKKWGTFTNLGNVRMNTCAAAGIEAGLGIQDGITISGIQHTALLLDVIAFFSIESTFVALQLGTTVINQFFNVTNLVAIGGVPGGVGIAGLANSGNVGTGIVANIRDSSFLGAITPLTGITTSDIQYDFLNSPPLENSSKAADMFLTTSETVIITTQSVFVPINGVNWVSDVEERFTISSAGVMTYLGLVTTKGQIMISATVAKVGGGADEIQLAIAINGNEAVKTVVSTQNANPTSLTSIGVFDLAENDTVQAFVANDGSTSNIDVFSCTVTVINGF